MQTSTLTPWTNAPYIDECPNAFIYRNGRWSYSSEIAPIYISGIYLGGIGEYSYLLPSTAGSYLFASPSLLGNNMYPFLCPAYASFSSNVPLLGQFVSAYTPLLGSWVSDLFAEPAFSPKQFVSDVVLAPLGWLQSGLSTVAGALPSCGADAVFAAGQLNNAISALASAQSWVNSIALSILGNNSFPSTYGRLVVSMNGSCILDYVASVLPGTGKSVSNW